ncbi:hypothetical protein [Actinocatenispora rupis]|uniref:Uncharacterized protein n=1 Tax=Actinocatenispora rupis TaxID=519421 RepID=A0A8J3NFF5_9ACTN|nr:hypothetical protein [Actinocatenispora rupis]GID15232.1 hypothetical protein Aru02nite_61210 [Actinocatenispora rupis]
METISRDQRPCTPLSINLPAFSAPVSGFPVPVEPRVERSSTAVDSGSPVRRMRGVGAPINGGWMAAFPIGEPIYVAPQFRTQGLSVSTEMHESVDAAGIDQQQGTGVGAASTLAMAAKVLARGIPPRGRPESQA